MLSSGYGMQFQRKYVAKIRAYLKNKAIGGKGSLALDFVPQIYHMFLTFYYMYRIINDIKNCRSCFAAGQFADAGSVTENIF